MPAAMRVTARDAAFQQWEALLANRRKRQRSREFLVQGVRPITMAVRHGWPVHALLHDAGRPLSAWAQGILAACPGQPVAMSGELLRELGGKQEAAPEVVAVVGMPEDDYARIPAGPGLLAVVFDRPASPGNIGTLIRSADAFGAAAVIVTGHGADPYDPRSVRASTGSLFAVPVIRDASHDGVLAWLDALRAAGTPAALVGTDESAGTDISHHDLTGPAVLVIGNETTGLSAAWRQCCDHLVRIPISGSASSLNAASAGTVALYEAARQRAAR